MRAMVMTLAFVLALALGAGHSAKASDETRIAGSWNSEYGTVIFNISPDGAISGFWNQDKGQGKISNGLFLGDSLAFAYYEPWSQARGIALLLLGPDGRTLTGRWADRDGQGKERHGEWTLTRE
jgi:hypothetical protein